MLSPTVIYMRMLLIHRTLLKKNLATKLRLANGFQESVILIQRGLLSLSLGGLMLQLNVQV
jgi:hypothetical protein